MAAKWPFLKKTYMRDPDEVGFSRSAFINDKTLA